jgi:hypothetical protein
MKTLILNLTVRLFMKHPKIFALILCIAFIIGLFLVGGCSNPQAENFSKQIMSRDHVIQKIVELKAADPEKPLTTELTEIEIRWILQSGFEAIGLTEDEAFAKVNELLGGEYDE